MAVDLKQVREMLDAITQGKWYKQLGGFVCCDGLAVMKPKNYKALMEKYLLTETEASDMFQNNAQLTANAPEWLREMADEIEALRAERDELVEQVGQYESMMLDVSR